jgi:3-oxoacyl-[acyl-carrier protein] reductase
LDGKNAVVCGSTQGIGKASAVELALLGADITLIARDERKLKAVVKDLPTPLGQKHDYLVADFNSPESLQSGLEKHFSRETFHILVNNTGGPAPGNALDAKGEEFVKAFTNHLLCNQVLVQALVPGMKKSGFGRIINIVSTSAKVPIRGLGVSNTIRGAVANWAKTLSLELAPFGITVNNVLPGTAMTTRLESLMKNRAKKSGKSVEDSKKEMIAEIPAGRIADPSEVAAAVAIAGYDVRGVAENGAVISYDAVRLRQLGIDPAQLSTALSSARMIDVIGAERLGATERSVVLRDVPSAIEDLGRLPITGAGGKIHRLDEVATIRAEEDRRGNFYRLNGLTAVTLTLTREGGADAIKTVARAREALAETQASLPQGIQLKIASDSSEDLVKQLNDLMLRGAIAFGAVARVLWLTLR